MNNACLLNIDLVNMLTMLLCPANILNIQMSNVYGDFFSTSLPFSHSYPSFLPFSLSYPYLNLTLLLLIILLANLPFLALFSYPLSFLPFFLTHLLSFLPFSHSPQSVLGAQAWFAAFLHLSVFLYHSFTKQSTGMS